MGVGVGNEKLWGTFAKSGPWALLAVLLIVFYLFKIDPAIAAITSDHAAMRAQFNEQRAEDAADARQLENILGQLLMSSERNVYLLRVQCQNTARTQTEQRACLKDKD